jgi:hypothetical protein
MKGIYHPRDLYRIDEMVRGEFKLRKIAESSSWQVISIVSENREPEFKEFLELAMLTKKAIKKRSYIKVIHPCKHL